MKRIINVIQIMLSIAVISIFSINVYADEAKVSNAEEMTKATQMTLSTEKSTAVFKDSKTSTKQKLTAGTTVDLYNKDGIGSLYIIWDRPIGEWKLDIGDKILTCGQNDFIHEYIELPYACEKLTIIIPENGAILCEIDTFSIGKVPEWVQTWQKPYERADMLLVPTHADDEHLFFGGTMPYYAGELGLKVQVVYLTNHWGEPYRPHELLNGLWTAGVTAYPVISDFVDQYAGSLEAAKKIYKEEEVLGYLVENIRRFKPMVIIGHDLNGEYGHGAHKLNALELTKAVTITNDATQYKESADLYGVWEAKKLYLHLYEENPIKMNWDIPLEKYDGKTAYEMAIEAFACHYSQRKYFSVRKTGVHDCQAFGLYWTTVGLDTGKQDFLENVELIVDDNKPIIPPVEDDKKPKDEKPDILVIQTNGIQMEAESNAKLLISVIATGTVALILLLYLFFRKE